MPVGRRVTNAQRFTAGLPPLPPQEKRGTLAPRASLTVVISGSLIASTVLTPTPFLPQAGSDDETAFSYWSTIIVGWTNYDSSTPYDLAGFLTHAADGTQIIGFTGNVDAYADLVMSQGGNIADFKCKGRYGDRGWLIVGSRNSGAGFETRAHPAWQYLAVQKPPFPAFADDLATSTSSLLRLLMTTDDKVPEDGVQLSMMDPSDKHVDKVKGDSSPRSSSSSSSSSDEAGPSNPAPAYDGPSDKYEGDPGVSDKKKVDTAEPDAGDIAVQVPSEPPPEFTHYKPEVEIDNDGNLFSHDHHLNEDGEALYRFILTQAHLPPSFLLKCHGSHQERRTRTVSRMENGRNVTRTETYYETVTDFSFIINITGHLILEGEDTPIWIVGDRDATYRGSVVRQVDNTPMPVGEGEAEPTENRDIEAGKAVMGRKTWRRKATEAEKQNAAGRRYRREETGLPPWVLLSGEVHGTEACIESERSRRRWQYATHSQAEGFDDSELLPPPKTLRDWADEYCASKKMLKEFQFRKVVFGWNISQLRMAVHTTIRANYLRPEEPSIDFKIGANEIDVRPDNRLSRMLSKTWVYVLLWIFLVYPLIIWPFKRFSSRGGGDWRVAGSAFALSKWAHLDDSSPGQTVEEYQELYNRTHPEGERLVLKQTPNGVSRLVGKREGEWFAEWEDTIGALVRQRCISSEPISIPMDGARGRAGSGLDGYNPH